MLLLYPNFVRVVTSNHSFCISGHSSLLLVVVLLFCLYFKTFFFLSELSVWHKLVIQKPLSVTDLIKRNIYFIDTLGEIIVSCRTVDVLLTGINLSIIITYSFITQSTLTCHSLKSN